jgi:hypothetical protein
MFRSVIGDIRNPPSAYLEQDSVLLLRSALAAVNTEDLRDRVPLLSGASNEEPTTHVIPLSAIIPPAPPDPGGLARRAVNATIYGYEPQPFITEVYVNTDCCHAGKSDGAQSEGIRRG